MEQIGTCSITTDISEQKQTLIRLAQAQKMEAVGRLTGGVAHDFNNLLAIIQGNAELLSERAENDPSLTQPILHASTRGAELTHSLLAFARQQTLKLRSIDLIALVERMIDLLSRTLGPDIRIERKMESGPVRALADPGQVEMALLNLALNARDAIGTDGTLRIACRCVPKPPAATKVGAGPYVMPEVADDGHGMSSETRMHAFEPFFTIKKFGKCSGLGLAMVYGFAKQSGGPHLCQSLVGVGTIMSLFLAGSGPRHRPEEGTRCRPSAAGTRRDYSAA